MQIFQTHRDRVDCFEAFGGFHLRSRNVRVSLPYLWTPYGEQLIFLWTWSVQLYLRALHK